jgi:hypothetical protein
VAPTYDVGWSQYDKSGSNLVTANFGAGYYRGRTCQVSTACNIEAGATAESLLTYIVNAQGNTIAARIYYGKLPTSILMKATAAVTSITP